VIWLQLFAFRATLAASASYAADSSSRSACYHVMICMRMRQIVYIITICSSLLSSFNNIVCGCLVVKCEILLVFER